MAIYTTDSRERLRDAIDFVELVSAHTDLRRAGPSRYEGLCPFHQERTPSFGIDPQKKLYHCFGCGASGDVFSFAQAIEGVDFKEALERLAERYNVPLELEQEDERSRERRARRERLYELLERACAYYEQVLWKSERAAPARAYLSERGLGQESLRAYRAGFAPPADGRLRALALAGGFSDSELMAVGLYQRSRQGGAPYERFRERICFPLIDMRGRVLGFGARLLPGEQGPKYLNSADNEIYHKGRNLYGASIARAAAAKAGEVILCEGYTDVIALHQAGIENVVGLMGTALTEQQVGELARLAPRVLLALDADNAGQAAMLRAAQVAMARRIELCVVNMPERGPGERGDRRIGDASPPESLDPAELVRLHGAEAMREVVAAPQPFMRFHVQRTLDETELSSAEGRDLAIERLRPVFASMPQSAQRLSLLALVSERLGLPEGIAERLLAQPAGAARGRSGGRVPAAAPGAAHPNRRALGDERRGLRGARRGADETRHGDLRGDAMRSGRDLHRSQRLPAGAGRATDGASGTVRGAAGRAAAVGATGASAGGLSRRNQAERAFLALCIAAPGAGAKALDQVVPGEHFTGEQMRLAAAHLQAGAIAEPLRALPGEQRELEELICELAAQGSAMTETATGEASLAAFSQQQIAAQIEVQRLQLELARIERLIQAARARMRTAAGGALGVGSPASGEAGGAGGGVRDRAPGGAGTVAGADGRGVGGAGGNEVLAGGSGVAAGAAGGAAGEPMGAVSAPATAAASGQSGPAISELAARRAEVKDAFDRAQERAMEALQ